RYQRGSEGEMWTETACRTGTHHDVAMRAATDPVVTSVVTTNPAHDRAVASQQYWERCRAELLDTADPMLRAAHRAACEHGFVLTRGLPSDCGLREAEVRRLVRSRSWTGVAHGVVSVLRDETEDGFDAERQRHAVRSAAAVLVR